MLKPALSTIALYDCTLAKVAEKTQAMGFEAIELRTFGDSSREFACDPALTADEKVRRMFRERGVEILSLATGCRFDEQIFPPVIGYLITDHERCVSQAQRAIDLAVMLECPFVRMFAFEVASNETRASAMKRIASRLAQVVDHADKSGVKVVIENAGSFSRASELRELIDRVDHPLLGASYALASGQAAGDLPEAAIALLGEKLWVARIKDLRAGKPVALGQGEIACERFVRALAASGFDGPLVYEWDRAWMPELPLDDAQLKSAARAMFDWGIMSSDASRAGAGGAEAHESPRSHQHRASSRSAH